MFNAKVSPETTRTAPMSVMEALREVFDPDLGANVVDLGLVYGLDVDEKNTLVIRMTMTSVA